MATQSKIIVDIQNSIRLRARRVNEVSEAARAAKLAQERGREVICAAHGGSVANKYGYPADTEGCVTIAWPDGSIWQRVVRLPANKVTLSGVVHAATGTRGLFDDRFSGEKKTGVRSKVIAMALAEIV